MRKGSKYLGLPLCRNLYTSMAVHTIPGNKLILNFFFFWGGGGCRSQFVIEIFFNKHNINPTCFSDFDYAHSHYRRNCPQVAPFCPSCSHYRQMAIDCSISQDGLTKTVISAKETKRLLESIWHRIKSTFNRSQYMQKVHQYNRMCMQAKS